MRGCPHHPAISRAPATHPKQCRKVAPQLGIAPRGNEPAMLSAFQDCSEAKPKNMARFVRKLYCNYSEQSFRDRLGSIKGHLHLLEVINIVTAAVLDLPEKDRLVLNAVSKPSRGDVVGTLSWHPWTKSWTLPVGEKRKVYGSVNRIEVGGGAPDGTGPYTRGPGETEPVFFHQTPPSLYHLICEEHPLCGAYDLTPGAGLLAVECVARRTSEEQAQP